MWLVALSSVNSGGSRNLERGSATGARSAPENFWVATPTFGHVNACIHDTRNYCCYWLLL